MNIHLASIYPYRLKKNYFYCREQKKGEVRFRPALPKTAGRQLSYGFRILRGNISYGFRKEAGG